MGSDAAVRINGALAGDCWIHAEFEAWFFNTLASKAKANRRCFSLLHDLNKRRDTRGPSSQTARRSKSRRWKCSGLVDIMPFAIVSRLFGADKPDPRIYHEAIRRLKLSFEGIDDIQPSEILFVGDNPYTDITGAAGVGMKSAWVRISDQYPDDAPKPDMEIGSVVELRGLLGLG